jgi:hypothetical protein
MVAEGTREVVDKWVKAIVDRDLDLEWEVSRPEIVHEFPQSGERISGRDNVRAVAENYPGGVPRDVETRTIGSKDTWVTTAAFTLLRIAGTGDVYTVIGQAEYPDGATWQVVSVLELREGAVAKVTMIFGPPFDPPEWRAKWVDVSSKPPLAPG